MKKQNKEKDVGATISRPEKGITLVALVITIIVLLILAGVSINAIQNNGGIIQNAKDAKDKYEVGKTQEEGEVGRLEQRFVELEIQKDFAEKQTPYKVKSSKTTTYITGVTVTGCTAETVESFKSNLPEGYDVVPVDGVTNVATGMKITKGEKEIGTIVVYGDINGDGKIWLEDVLKVTNCLNNNIELEEVQKIAANVDFDKDIDSDDEKIINEWYESGEGSVVDQNVIAESNPEEIIVLSKDYYLNQYIKNLPPAFTSTYKVYYSEQYSRYQIDVTPNTVTAEQFLSTLNDENAVLKVFVEGSGMVEKSDSTPITKAAELYITYPGFEGNQKVITIMAK